MFAAISSHLSHRWPTFVAAAVCFSALLVLPELTLAQFTQQGPKLVGFEPPPQPLAPTAQGFSVALSADGNTAIVGAPVGGIGDNDGTGAVWVYIRSNGVWFQQGLKLVPNAGGVNRGWSVALSADGSTAIVGGSGDNSNAGAVFTRSGGGTGAVAVLSLRRAQLWTPITAQY
jgi:hypothetical protein